METLPSTCLSECAMRLMDASAVDRVRRAIERGTLQASSTAAIRATVAAGDGVVESAIRDLQSLWTAFFGGLRPADFASLIEVAASAILLERRRAVATEIVWTGPAVEGSYVRATREVVREITSEARTELIVAGYWLAARENADGVIEELIEMLSDAIARGVDVALALDSRDREGGVTNKSVLLSVWPRTVRLPRLLTWRLPSSDPYLKLHAKVLVADGRDALITSANLTQHAMNENMEMGVRVGGDPARKVRDHLRRLQDLGILETF